jgi:hypothetical protein
VVRLGNVVVFYEFHELKLLRVASARWCSCYTTREPTYMAIGKFEALLLGSVCSALMAAAPLPLVAQDCGNLNQQEVDISHEIAQKDRDSRAIASQQAQQAQDDADRMGRESNFNLDSRFSSRDLDVNVPEFTVETRHVEIHVPRFGTRHVTVLVPESQQVKVGELPGHWNSECGMERKSLPFGGSMDVPGCHRTNWEPGPPIMAWKIVQVEHGFDVPNVSPSDEIFAVDMPKVNVTNPAQRVRSDLPEIKGEDRRDDKDRAASNARAAEREMRRVAVALKPELLAEEKQRLHTAVNNYFDCRFKALAVQRNQAVSELTELLGKFAAARKAVDALPSEVQSTQQQQIGEMAAMEAAMAEQKASSERGFDAEKLMLQKEHQSRLAFIDTLTVPGVAAQIPDNQALR